MRKIYSILLVMLNAAALDLTAQTVQIGNGTGSGLYY